MAKWEYAIGSYWKSNKKNETSEIECAGRSFKGTSEMLNHMGNEGWELTGVSTFVTYEKPSFADYVLIYTNVEYFYFKRQKV